MRRVLLLLAMVVGGMVVAACDSPQQTIVLTNTQIATLQNQAAMYQIDQIEVTWHRAASTKNLNLMMTLWADNATFQIGLNTYSGKAQIRSAWAASGPFQPQNDWVDETPAYKEVITVSGNTGTIYFQCHFVDVTTGKVAGLAATKADVALINGRWLITRSIASTPTLSP
jgi:hypothetical protein